MTDLERAVSIARRRVAATRPQTVSLAPVLFGPQRAFFSDPASFADAVCSRRAGKTVGIGAWLLEGPVVKPGAPSLYLTITRGSAKRNIWGTLLDLNRQHGLGYEPNEADLILKRNGRGMVYLVGIDNRSEIEKVRGTGWGRVAIDEAQALPAYVKELVEDVLMPALADHDGQIRMIGTPPPVPVGYFHEASKSAAWSHHAWNVWQNPHVPGARAMLDKVLAVRGVTEDDPSIRREWWGQWCLDVSSLVFRWDEARNAYDALPPRTKPYEHVIGVDLGFDDADAIAVLAWSPESPDLYLVDEWVGTKQTVTELGERLRRMEARYKPLAIVADTGGLGKKIAIEITERTGIAIEAADKARKLEHIELLNDALRSGRFHAKADSRFAHDAMLVEWDRDKSTNDKRVISDRFHSDVCDSVLYAYRRALHWLHEPKADAPPAPGTPGWAASEAQRMEHEALEQWHEREREREDLGWEW